jgi:hypothetical protein
MPKGIRNKPLNLTVLTKRYKIMSDESGHDYIIAVGDERDFEAWSASFIDDEFPYYGPGYDDRRINCHNLTFLDPQGWK